ncbi:hypothetical protein BJ508DRAFT_419592 [Ascobolus immersus RN42]|uniref:Uncharacterized protein n=1 Tax=Ascobolus immersus RN42 TaxID=1160509 RepID=A0A3N4HD11_ASCIM|nr:hypothetical protein BJ508DRAFT_419592 [Ascobolus immersus RN42]
MGLSATPILVISGLTFLHSIYSTYEHHLLHPSTSASLPLDILLPLLISSITFLATFIFGTERFPVREVEVGKAFGAKEREGGGVHGGVRGGACLWNGLEGGRGAFEDFRTSRVKVEAYRRETSS